MQIINNKFFNSSYMQTRALDDKSNIEIKDTSFDDLTERKVRDKVLEKTYIPTENDILYAIQNPSSIIASNIFDYKTEEVVKFIKDGKIKSITIDKLKKLIETKPDTRLGFLVATKSFQLNPKDVEFALKNPDNIYAHYMLTCRTKEVVEMIKQGKVKDITMSLLRNSSNVYMLAFLKGDYVPNKDDIAFMIKNPNAEFTRILLDSKKSTIIDSLNKKLFGDITLDSIKKTLRENPNTQLAYGFVTAKNYPIALYEIQLAVSNPKSKLAAAILDSKEKTLRELAMENPDSDYANIFDIDGLEFKEEDIKFALNNPGSKFAQSLFKKHGVKIIENTEARHYTYSDTSTRNITLDRLLVASYSNKPLFKILSDKNLIPTSKEILAALNEPSSKAAKELFRIKRKYVSQIIFSEGLLKNVDIGKLRKAALDNMSLTTIFERNEYTLAKEDVIFVFKNNSSTIGRTIIAKKEKEIIDFMNSGQIDYKLIAQFREDSMNEPSLIKVFVNERYKLTIADIKFAMKYFNSVFARFLFEKKGKQILKLIENGKLKDKDIDLESLKKTLRKYL